MNTGQNYIIKKAASIADFEAAKSLFLQYQAELKVDLCFQSFEEELLQLPIMYGQNNGCLLLAMKSNLYIGCVGTRRKDSDTCEMKRLFVQPAYKNQGIGRSLVEQIISESIFLGYKKMILDTLEHLVPALHLYKSYGFKETGAYYNNPLQHVVYLEKDL